MSALISVIIPVYNGERYISTIVESLENQVFNDFEVIFVNDGSTDKSLECLRKIERSNPEKYKVITQENAGVSSARNTGLLYANGKYISFVDVDDQLDVQYLNILYCYTNGKDSVAVIGGQAKELTRYSIENITVKSYTGNKLLEAFLYGKISTGVCGMLIPRKILDTYKLLFKNGYRYSEDLHMVWRVFCHIQEAIFVDVPIYIYRDTANSAMSKIDEKRLDSLYLIRQLEGYFDTYHSEFSALFQKYGVARMAWSLLWQAAHYLSYNEFKEFLKLYDFKSEMKKLKSFPDKRVTLSALCFRLSIRIYHLMVSYMTRKYRSNSV